MPEEIELQVDKGDGKWSFIVTSSRNLYAEALMSLRRGDVVYSAASGFRYRLPVHEHKFVCAGCGEAL